MNIKTALITGASSGIGKELAIIHASNKGNLILVARNIKALNILKKNLESNYGVSVYIIKKDLSVTDAALEVYNEIKKQNLKVNFLINNAGFGDFGFFSETSWEKERNMINLNITTLTQFCKLFIKDMVKNGDGKIMNIASTAAFQPGPTMAVYYATKAYVLHFTEAIANELKHTGISITALCPGATTSGFQKTAAMENSNLVKGKKLPTSKQVAEYGYKAMLKGKTVAIHGWKNYLLANSIRFTPRSIVVKFVRKLQDKVD